MLKLLAVEEKLRSLARSVERLSIQMEEQHFTRNEIRKLLVDDHHAFGSSLVDKSSEGKNNDEESGETPILVKESVEYRGGSEQNK